MIVVVFSGVMFYILSLTPSNKSKIKATSSASGYRLVIQNEEPLNEILVSRGEPSNLDTIEFVFSQTAQSKIPQVDPRDKNKILASFDYETNNNNLKVFIQVSDELINLKSTGTNKDIIQLSVPSFYALLALEHFRITSENRESFDTKNASEKVSEIIRSLTPDNYPIILEYAN